MPARSTPSDTRRRTPFRSRREDSAARVAALAERARPLESPRTGDPEPAQPVTAEIQSELGEATYQCGCGFVFQAPVLTSVACPHCGDCQAW